MENIDGKKKEWRKKKWKGIMLNQSNIDEYMKDLRLDTKGQYITQGVSFNKDDALQMNLLKQTLLTHGTFSGFIKHLLYSYFANQQQQQNQISVQQNIILQQNGENALHDESVLDYGDSKTDYVRPVIEDVKTVVHVTEEVESPKVYIKEENIEDEEDNVSYPILEPDRNKYEVNETRKILDRAKGISKFLESNPNAKKPN